MLGLDTLLKHSIYRLAYMLPLGGGTSRQSNSGFVRLKMSVSRLSVWKERMRTEQSFCTVARLSAAGESSALEFDRAVLESILM